MFLDSCRRESSYMFQKLPHPYRAARLLACTSTLILALGLGGCQTAGLSDITGSIDEKADTGRASASWPGASAASWARNSSTEPIGTAPFAEPVGTKARAKCPRTVSYYLKASQFNLNLGLSCEHF